MKFFENFKKSNKNEKIEKILPSDVRYALQYKEGMLNKEEIETLVMSNFESEGFYLIAKGIQEKPEIQKSLVENYAKIILNDKTNSKMPLKEFLSKEINNITETEVNGVKLAQVSRQGFELWQKKYEEIARELSNNKKDIFVLAHSTFVGLSHFIKEFSKNNKTVNILIPLWFEKDQQHIGYSINFNQKEVTTTWLDKSFKKESSIIFDDTIKTGGTISKINSHISENLGDSPEIISLDKVI